MRNPTEQEYIDLADTLQVPVQYIQKLYAEECIDRDACMAKLIKRDFCRLNDNKTFREKEMVKVLSTKYQVPPALVYSVIYQTRQNTRECEQCKAVITAMRYNAYGGLCTSCYDKYIIERAKAIIG